MTGQLDPATYEAWFDQPWGAHAFEVERDALLTALRPLEGRRLLDVGCGTGRFTAAFEAAGAHVTGVDRDPDMLAAALGAFQVAVVAPDRGSRPARCRAAADEPHACAGVRWRSPSRKRGGRRDASEVVGPELASHE